MLRPGDRVCLEGDNQKQADCLARGLALDQLRHR
ncbi:malonate decarboxylase subunit alpha [Methylobacterium sp. E-066]|nr:malonate decarboxylase subunit alpha [Methylobacterium sp. E-066]MCJ2141244.1 malonate decarboxylase subunit alpha [Methylobacterium sp. E-066]